MNTHLIHIVTVMGLLGIPSIFSISMWCFRCCRRYTKQLQVLIKAQQEQMKNILFEQYKEYIKKGYIDLDSLSVWESNYQAYHSLGKNGVMDNKREELMNLPNTKEIKDESKD